MYVRNQGYFQNEVSYYFSESDSSVKVILYEWDTNDGTYQAKNEWGEKFNQFKEQWDDLVRELTKQLGQPSDVKIESYKFKTETTDKPVSLEEMLSNLGNNRNESTAWRDDMKWAGRNGVNAYLFMFGDNRTGHRQIRLSIYGEWATRVHLLVID